VRFIKPAQPEAEIIAIGELTLNRRNRIFEAKGELRGPQGEVLATATGKFMPIAPEFLLEMSADFVGDPTPFLAAVGRQESRT